jgi:hypothetical protein
MDQGLWAVAMVSDCYAGCFYIFYTQKNCLGRETVASGELVVACGCLQHF